MTSKRKRNLPTHVLIASCEALKSSSTVMLEQIKTIDKMRLEEYLGRLDDKQMRKVDLALATSLGTSVENLNTAISIGPASNQIPERKERKVMRVKKNTIFDTEEYDWMRVVEEQIAFLMDVQHMTNLELEQDNLDNEIEELLDYIEVRNCNAAQGFQLYKMLKERRIRRREIIEER